MRTFGWSFGITAVALTLAFFYGGIEALILCAILGVLEISLSFDNAVVNARILEKMSAFWQKMFLTVGILIAVVGMRIAFPLLIVGVTANLNPIQAVQLALEKGDIHTEGSYAYLLHDAHPQIAAFGGVFLLWVLLQSWRVAAFWAAVASLMAGRCLSLGVSCWRLERSGQLLDARH